MVYLTFSKALTNQRTAVRQHVFVYRLKYYNHWQSTIVLLNLRAIFDATEHQILLKRLHHIGNVHKWKQSQCCTFHSDRKSSTFVTHVHVVFNCYVACHKIACLGQFCSVCASESEQVYNLDTKFNKCMCAVFACVCDIRLLPDINPIWIQFLASEGGGNIYIRTIVSLGRICVLRCFWHFSITNNLVVFPSVPSACCVVKLVFRFEIHSPFLIFVSWLAFFLCLITILQNKSYIRGLLEICYFLHIVRPYLSKWGRVRRDDVLQKMLSCSHSPHVANRSCCWEFKSFNQKLCSLLEKEG